MARRKTITVSIVDGDAEVRESLALLLNKARGFRCAGSHATAEAALQGIPAEHPDVVLMGIHLPVMGGIECVRQLTASQPGLLVLMLTVCEDTDKIFQSLRAGASGYLLRRTPQAELLQAIRQAVDGGSPLSGRIARKVVQYFHHTAASTGIRQLSPRERQVLEHLAQGLLYKEIGERLGISIDTVRKHLHSVYQKLDVHSRTEAVVKYLGK